MILPDLSCGLASISFFLGSWFVLGSSKRQVRSWRLYQGVGEPGLWDQWVWCLVLCDLYGFRPQLLRHLRHFGGWWQAPWTSWSWERDEVSSCDEERSLEPSTTKKAKKVFAFWNSKEQWSADQDWAPNERISATPPVPSRLLLRGEIRCAEHFGGDVLGLGAGGFGALRVEDVGGTEGVLVVWKATEDVAFWGWLLHVTTLL